MASERLGELLREAGLVSDADLRAALLEQQRRGGRLGEILVRRGLVSERKLQEFLARQQGLPVARLADLRPSADFVRLLPESLLRRAHVLPIRIEQSRLLLAIADPLNYEAIEDARLVTGLPVDPVVVPREEIDAYLDRHLGGRRSPERGAVAPAPGTEGEGVATTAVEAVGDDSPVAQLVGGLLQRAIRARASDVHLEPTDRVTRVRVRVDGTLREDAEIPRALHRQVVTRIKILSGLNIAETRLPQDGRLQVAFEGRNVDVRVATLPVLYGEKVALRILAGLEAFESLDRLDFTPDNLSRLRAALWTGGGGMVLIVGPTGSGKTATAYAALREVSTPEVNAVSIEDPVELALPHVGQVAVNPAIGLTFAAGLRAMLRQDPDFVMIGEIRDAETADIAMRAALTGRRVLSTLHTGDAAQSVTRLLEMGVERYLIASALSAVVTQRLVRRVCPGCAEPRPLDEASQAFLVRMQADGAWQEGAIDPAGDWLTGRGCEVCGGTGFRGRMAIQEVLAVSDDLRHLILDHASERDLRAWARRTGHASLASDGIAKAAQGLTTVGEVMRVV